jgi:hypothetical protein
MVHRQLSNALVELALQIISLFLRSLLVLPQPLPLVFALRDFAGVALDQLFLLSCDALFIPLPSAIYCHRINLITLA